MGSDGRQREKDGTDERKWDSGKACAPYGGADCQILFDRVIFNVFKNVAREIYGKMLSVKKSLRKRIDGAAAAIMAPGQTVKMAGVQRGCMAEKAMGKILDG